jgi:alcohol dehydrogenase class IV
VGRDKLPELTRRALEDASHRTNPRPVPAGEMERLIAALL